MIGRRPSIRVDLRAILIALLALTLITGGFLLNHQHGAPKQLSAKAAIAADPPPTLFPEAAIKPTEAEISAVRADAAARLRTWVAQHGTRPDDVEFVTWVEQTFPGPPLDLAAQMPRLVALSHTRTTNGVKASTWLETHGKKDIWKLYAHDQRELLGSADAGSLKNAEKQVLAMSKQIADALGARFGSSAPYVRRPSLRPDHQVTSGQKCPCSYPSRHAAAGAASETLLGHLQPRLDAQYRYLEAEIDYSRIYMAGHFPADVTAGALLGDLIGDYVLVTREGVPPETLT